MADIIERCYFIYTYHHMPSATEKNKDTFGFSIIICDGFIMCREKLSGGDKELKGVLHLINKQ